MSKRKILIAEDEKYTRNTLSFVLENAGYHVVEAKNGQEALHLILQIKQSGHPIDLMILDIEMSGLTGWQVLDELQRHQVSIPTIVITGLIDEQMLQKIRNNGGLECLKKPFEPKEVTVCVSRALKEQKQLKKNPAKMYHVCKKNFALEEPGRCSKPLQIFQGKEVSLCEGPLLCWYVLCLFWSR